MTLGGQPRLFPNGLLMGAVLLSAIPQVVQAQDQTQGSIETVVVTALKRDVSVQNAPAAITALSGDQLRNDQITNVAQISEKVPSLDIGAAGGTTLVAIRGVSMDAIIGGLEGSVAIHNNGVYLSQAAPMDFLLMDVGSVEVLRGPQGTLYGRNATGGAINFAPAQPTDTFGGYVNAGYGNFNTWRVESAVSGPLTDNLQGRLYVMHDARETGYAENLATGNHLGGYNESGARGALRYEPTSNLTVDLSGFWFNDYDTLDFWTNTTPPSAAAIASNPDFLNHPISFDPRKFYFDFEPAAHQLDEGAQLEANWVISPDIALRSSTAYVYLNFTRQHGDCEATATPTCSANRVDKSKSFQQEFDLKFSLFDKRLSGLLGAFYDQDKGDFDQEFPWNNAAQGFVFVDGAPLPNGSQTEQIFTQTTTSKALFTDLTLKLTDAVDLYGGARWSEDRRSILLTSGLQVVPGLVLGCSDDTDRATFNNISGKAGVQYHFSDGGQIYAQWQQGFKAGGFNPAACSGASDAIFKPETITAYEIGYKTTAFDDTLTFNAAAFYYDYSNLQIAQIFGVSYQIVNAASATIGGVELESTWKPTSALSFDANASLIPEAKYGDYDNFDPLNPGSGTIPCANAPLPTDLCEVLTGKRLNRAPKFTLNFGAQYDWALNGLGDVVLRGEVYHSSDVYFRPFNLPSDTQSAYTLGNLYATFIPENSNFAVRAYVRNVSNETVLSGEFTEDVTQSMEGQFAPPRTYGVTASYTF